MKVTCLFCWGMKACDQTEVGDLRSRPTSPPTASIQACMLIRLPDVASISVERRGKRFRYCRLTSTNFA